MWGPLHFAIFQTLSPLQQITRTDHRQESSSQLTSELIGAMISHQWKEMNSNTRDSVQGPLGLNWKNTLLSQKKPYCLPAIHVTNLQFRISIRYNKKEMKFINSNTSSLSTGTESWTIFPINSNFEFNCYKTSRTSTSFSVADFLFSSVFFIISVASSLAFFYKQILKFNSIPNKPKN